MCIRDSVVGFPGGLGRAGKLVTKLNVLMDEIANRLHACPARLRVPEQAPGLGGQQIGFAIAAAEQEDQRLLGQILKGELVRLRCEVVYPCLLYTSRCV